MHVGIDYTPSLYLVGTYSTPGRGKTTTTTTVTEQNTYRETGLDVLSLAVQDVVLDHVLLKARQQVEETERPQHLSDLNVGSVRIYIIQGNKISIIA